MFILVINTGSSSIKYQLFRMPDVQPLCVGLVERIGIRNSNISHKVWKDTTFKTHTEHYPIPDYATGLKAIKEMLTHPKFGVILDTDVVKIVGHRVVHGGESFSNTTFITKAVKEKVKNLFSLAPLHNPGNYEGIEIAEAIFPNAKQIGVFDTSFHQTMPEKAYRYAIPYKFYKEDKIRAYGFHGTSHKYVSEVANQMMGTTQSKLITIHLGNGCSMVAVKNGKSVDSSMGFGPLSGLIMGTRSGDIDPSVVFHMIEQMGLDPSEVNHKLNKESGMLGLTGHSDMRDVRKAGEQGDATALLAYEMYTYRIKKYIGAFAAAMNGLDGIVFTAGVGENDQLVRKMVCADMDYLGIRLDEAKNEAPNIIAREIQGETSCVRVFVIPTNEELEIARQCYALVNKDI